MNRDSSPSRTPAQAPDSREAETHDDQREPHDPAKDAPTKRNWGADDDTPQQGGI